MTGLEPHPLAATIAATAPSYTAIAFSQAEFVDWARRTGMDDRVVDFLASRDDLAGANPRQWTQFSQALGNADYRALRCDQQNQIAILLVGDQAFLAYREWLVARQN